MATDEFIELTCNIRPVTDALECAARSVKDMRIRSPFTGYFHIKDIKLFQAMRMVNRLKMPYRSHLKCYNLLLSKMPAQIIAPDPLPRIVIGRSAYHMDKTYSQKLIINSYKAIGKSIINLKYEE